jgi:S-formylglutathione hydrolase FrmB
MSAAPLNDSYLNDRCRETSRRKGSETYHIGVLRSWVDHHLRTAVGDDAVAGLSMGGFGAMSYAARYPEMFHAAASFSGVVDTQYGAPASGVLFDELNSQYGTPNDRVWGNQLTDASTWAAHNPTVLAAQLAGTDPTLGACTTGPTGKPTFTGLCLRSSHSSSALPASQ